MQRLFDEARTSAGRKFQLVAMLAEPYIEAKRRSILIDLIGGLFLDHRHSARILATVDCTARIERETRMQRMPWRWIMHANGSLGCPLAFTVRHERCRGLPV